MAQNTDPRSDVFVANAYRAAARRLYPGAVVDEDALVSTAPDGAYVEIAIWIGNAAEEPAAAIAESYTGTGLVERELHRRHNITSA